MYAAAEKAKGEDKSRLESTALIYAENAIAKNPKDASSHFIIGMDAFNKKDYQKALDELTESIELSIKWTDAGYTGLTDEENIKMNYKHNGTLGDHGSSIIGDGLAGCLYSFVDLEENKDRSRIIILATDNDLYGDYYVSLEEASDLCKKHKVKVYGIAPEEVAKEDEYKSSVEKTGGKYYKYTSKEVIEELISDISKTDKSDLDMIETVMYDKPETFFWMMLICLAAYFTLSRIVKK